MRITHHAVLVVALVGCGGSSDDGVPLTVHAANAKLAAVRTGTTWQPLTLDTAGDVTIDLAGPTMIATVCDDGDFVDYYTVATGPRGDTGELEMSCADSRPTATVTVVAPTTTRVFVGFDRAPGGSTLDVPQGTYDAIAIDTTMSPARIEVRRALAIAGAMTLTFDLAATGTPMVHAGIAATGAAAGDDISTSVVFRTTTTFASWPATALEAWIVPPSLLVASDKHSARASTFDDVGGSRSAQRRLAGTEGMVTLALPPYLASVTPSLGAEPHVTWSGDPRWDTFYYGVNNAEFSKFWDITILPAWSTAGGTTATITIPDPHTLPGWSSAWELGGAADPEWAFFAMQNTGDESFTASASGAF